MNDKTSTLLTMMAIYGATNPSWNKLFTPKRTWRDTQSEEDKGARLKKAQEKRDRKAGMKGMRPQLFIVDDILPERRQDGK